MNKEIKEEIESKLSRIFPNDKIEFHVARSHKNKIDGEYVGIYFNGICMSMDEINGLSWWISIMTKFEAMKEQLDEPDMIHGDAFYEHIY